MRAIAHAPSRDLPDQRLRDSLAQILGNENPAPSALQPSLELRPVLPPLLLLLQPPFLLGLFRLRGILPVAVLLVAILPVPFRLHLLVIVVVTTRLLVPFRLLLVPFRLLLAVLVAILLAAAGILLLKHRVPDLLPSRPGGARGVDAQQAPARGLRHQAQTEPR